MLGFVPGLPFCYQLEPRERQVQVPKYVRPRTFTPERAFGIGGAFSVIYPVQGAGGYQLYGISPVPVLDVRQDHPDFAHSIVFPKVGDIWRYRSIDRAEYDETRAQVESGEFRFRQRDVEFSPSAFLADPQAVNDRAAGGALRVTGRIAVTSGGLSTTVQDLGRPGRYSHRHAAVGGHGPVLLPGRATSWSATTRERRPSRRRTSVPRSSSPTSAWSPSPAATRR